MAHSGLATPRGTGRSRKQRAVKPTLAHPKRAGLSDHQLAKHVGLPLPLSGIDGKINGGKTAVKPASRRERSHDQRLELLAEARAASGDCDRASAIADFD